MNSILEQARQIHQEIEEYERASVFQLIQKPKNHKELMLQQTRVSHYVDNIQNLSRQLLKIYADPDDLFAEDLKLMSDNNFDEFYSRLKEIKDFYSQIPSESVLPFDPQKLLKDPDEEMHELEAVFTGEETFGRHLDLHGIFLDYCNINGVNQMSYLTYLDRFDRFKDIGLAIKKQPQYFAYINKMLQYFIDWIKKSQPLFNCEELESTATDEFEQKWKEGTVPDWPKPKADPLKGDKLFAKASVFEAHKTGKKHLKGIEKLREQGMDENTLDGKTALEQSLEDEYEKTKIIAKTEFIIKQYVAHLAVIRDETKSHVERKQALTEKERLDVAEEAPIQIEESSDEDEDKIYNPLKLPIGWDGKPIPFWLYKLHGLGQEFPCEICGGYVYMGRKAFEVHFTEYRHAHGLRCLGIPNSRYFQDITKIDDAYKLAEKLKQSRRDEVANSEVIEEFEDEEGNVYDKRTYEDLKRQGIL